MKKGKAKTKIRRRRKKKIDGGKVQLSSIL